MAAPGMGGVSHERGTPVTLNLGLGANTEGNIANLRMSAAL